MQIPPMPSFAFDPTEPPLEPGECDSAGNIQSPDPAIRHTSGIVWIALGQAEAAMAHGWKLEPSARDFLPHISERHKLVQVSR